MEELTYLRLYNTIRAQSHKWEVDADGNVTYYDEVMTPREAYERFLVDYPIFNVIRADVIRRVLDEDGPKGYRWDELERFR